MENVITIDCNYVTKEVAASFLLPGGSQSVILEVNTGFAVDAILHAVSNENLHPDDIRYLIVTHIHLDHAAGAGHLMDIFKNAELICHPAAKRHLHNPERLIRSAKMVYGEKRFHEFYGEIKSVDENRIIAVDNLSSIDLPERKLTFYHTAGHAKHHICIHDSLSNGVFTGDSFGLAYPLLQTNGLMIYPATTAIDFDPAEARKSIDTIVNTGADILYLTHFGELQDIENAKQRLLEGLDFSEDLMNRAAQSDMTEEEVQEFCYRELLSYMDRYMERLRLSLSLEERTMLDIDTQINSSGIAFAALRKRKKADQK